MAGMDCVTELDVPWLPSTGAPAPIVWASETETVVIFDPVVSAAPNDELAVLRFLVCTSAVFGYPNDEALDGHPLYARGLRSYGVFEVTNSSWITRLRDQNQISFPDSRPFARARHFIVTFHDSMFECVAADMEGSFTSKSVEEILRPYMRVDR